MVSVFEYENPNEFLRDLINEAKVKNSIVSYRYISNKTKIDASNIAKVVQGKRNLSIGMARELAHFFKLKKRDGRYLESLVKLAKTSDDLKRQQIFNDLMKIRNVSPQKIEAKQYDLYQKWYHMAILAQLHYFEFTDDYKRLAMSLDPEISEKKAKESIDLLMELGLIKKNDDGKFIHTHTLISTGEEWRSIAIKTFQRDMLELALRSLDHHHQQHRDISTITITGSHEDIEKIKSETKKFRKNVLRIAEDSEVCEHVYQLNVQLFPLTKVSKNDKRN